nr:pentatricopeptide repeat-containing protein At1g06710, mitochondrial [Ipomoea batatas]
MSRRNALFHLRLLRSFCRKATPPTPPLLDAFNSSSRGDDDHTRLPGLVADEDQTESHSFSPQEFAFLKDSLQGKSTSDGVDDVALSIISVLRENGGLGDKSLRQFREKLNPDLVVRVLRDIRNAELGVKFFMWAGRQIGYSHNVAVYDALIDLVVVSRPGSNMNAAMPEQFLHDIMDDDKEVLGKLLNVLVLKCCRNGLWNLALEELGRLKNFGYKPSRVTYNALIQVFLQAGRLDSATLIYREMSGLGFKMDVHTLNCFTRSLCKGGKWREALDLIEKEGLVADTVTYTSMISGLCEGSFFEEAMDFLNRMRSSSCVPNRITYMDYSYAYKLLKKMDHCGCQPGYVVYNILIGGICGNEELPSKEMLELAEKIYGEMLDGGVVLNKVNVCNFVRCLCGFQKFEDAFHVIHEMMKKGFIPDVSTYSKVIGFLCDASKIDKAFMLFQEMKKNGLVPDVYTYTILIDSFCKAGLIQQARSWFDEMRSEGYGFGKAGKVEKCLDLIQQMSCKGCAPNYITYVVTIKHCCSAGLLDEAVQLLEEMKQTYWPRHMESYHKIVEGFNREYLISLGLLEEMSNNSSISIFPVYRILIDSFLKAGRLEVAADLHKEISSSSSFSYRGKNIYASLIENLCLNLKVDKAFEVYADMIKKGEIPEMSIFVNLIKGLILANQWENALELSKSLCDMDICWLPADNKMDGK